MVFVQHREMAEQERAEASASPDSATENLETSGEEQEILVVPHVELYEMDYAGTYRTLEYEGKMLITCKTTSAVEEGSSQEAQRLWLVAGSLRLELHEERNCLEQVPGVYMLPSDDPSTFFIVAVGSSKEDIDCLPKLHHLLMEACMYKKGEGYEEAAERLVTLAEDPKILGVSSKSIGNAVRTTSQGIAWGLNVSGKGVSQGIAAGTEWAIKSGIVRPARFQAQVHPEVQKALEATAEVARKTREGFVWAIETTIDWAVQKGKKSAESASNTKTGKWTKSESVRAMAHIGSQLVNAWFDVGDAVEDAAGTLGLTTVNSSKRILHHSYGKELATASSEVFKTTGHVVGTALGYRLYRRPGTKTTIRGEGWQGDGAPEDRDSGPNLLVQEAGAVQKDQVRFETDEERESRATE